MFYLGIYFLALLLTALLTLLVKRIAFYFKVVDEPDTGSVASRKIHTRTTPLLGGLAIFLAYFILLFSFKN